MFSIAKSITNNDNEQVQRVAETTTLTMKEKCLETAIAKSSSMNNNSYDDNNGDKSCKE